MASHFTGFDPISADMGIPYGFDDETGGSGGGGDVTVKGTSGEHTGNTFAFRNGSDSNVKFEVDGGNGEITVNVYYA